MVKDFIGEIKGKILRQELIIFLSDRLIPLTHRFYFSGFGINDLLSLNPFILFFVDEFISVFTLKIIRIIGTEGNILFQFFL